MILIIDDRRIYKKTRAGSQVLSLQFGVFAGIRIDFLENGTFMS
jgi:hypothetical protein